MNEQHPVLEHLERTAERVWTPCGAGARMVWRRWGSGRPLVLLHGGAGSWMHWARNIEALAAHRTVWAPDMPGFADSDLPREGLDADSIADIVASNLPQIVGAQHFDLVGFSFGALVSSYIAAQAPPGLDRLIVVSGAGLGLLGPMPVLQPVGRVTDPDARRESLRFNLQAMMLHDPASIDDLAIEIQARSATRERVKGRRLVHTDAMRALSACWQCRAYGIWSRQDVLYAHQFDALTARVQDLGLAAHRFIDRGGHWLLYENAEEANQFLLECLYGD